MFFRFGYSLQNSQNILFSFPSNINHLYLSSWNKHVFLARAGDSDAVLISLPPDDCFPPKKDYNVSVSTYFGSHFNSSLKGK